MVLCSAAVIQTSDSGVIEGCESETQLWGSPDGTKFRFCIGDDIALELPCDPNTFFVKNATVCGCIPLDQVADDCVYHVSAPTCEGQNLKQPQPHQDPTKYWLCPSSGAKPVELSCPANKAFVNQNGYLGCFEWTQWRSIRGCVDTD